MISRNMCEDCKFLPEGEVIEGHDHRNDYDLFVKQGRSVSFTDEQIDFLADWLCISDGQDHSELDQDKQ